MTKTPNMKPYQIKLRYFLIPCLLKISLFSLAFFLCSLLFTQYFSESFSRSHFYQTYLTWIEWNGIVSLFCLTGIIATISIRSMKIPLSFLEFKKYQYKNAISLSLFGIQMVLLISAYLFSTLGISTLSQLDDPTQWHEKGMPIYFTVDTADFSGPKAIQVQSNPSQKYSKAIDVFCVIKLTNNSNLWAGFNYPFSVDKAVKFASDEVDSHIKESIDNCQNTSLKNVKYFKKSDFAFENSGYLNALKNIVNSELLENNNLMLFVASQHHEFENTKSVHLTSCIIMLTLFMAFMFYDLWKSNIHWESYWAIKYKSE
ncbi:hypothetical protein [Shewanella saliphila]|uniref:hypothetical protein n=1 Tax=Shewanella saliphila TaxID=2282698 RepID=UPI0016638388|nr:hypothetical protein [Shewanella saliphila]MCL1100751.1 hypothetical protein [Shewanella saliphila]